MGTNRRSMGAVAVLASASLLLASCSNDEGTDKGNSSTPEDNSASTSVHEQASKNNRDDVPPVADNPSPAVKNLPPHFDFEAHRGGRGEWTEESKKAFETALELNATTLELDVVITKDGVPRSGMIRRSKMTSARIQSQQLRMTLSSHTLASSCTS